MGLPEEAGEENDFQTIQNIAKTEFEINMKQADVAEVYRLGRISDKKKCRDTIVKFNKKCVRDQLYSLCQKKRTFNSEFFCGPPGGRKAKNSLGRLCKHSHIKRLQGPKVTSLYMSVGKIKVVYHLNMTVYAKILTFIRYAFYAQCD